MSKNVGIKCLLTREQFKRHAKGMLLQLTQEGKQIENLPLPTKEFKGISGTPDGTGSLGWYTNCKFNLVIDGVSVKIQCQVILTVIGSKTDGRAGGMRPSTATRKR